ncbi:MAG TPA: energy transducer TonB, partial [Longimicrobiaceae bacterium]|nr:energy transducer TonB [Longimicrobiaceae bacterium]
TGGGDGGGVGSGEGPGTGRGEGGTSMPRAELLLIPPDAPRALRGRTVEVTLTIDPAGRVREAEITRSSGDRRYDESLRRRSLEWKFYPARDAGNRPVEVKHRLEFDI